MSFKDQMAADAAIFFNTNEFAEVVTYNGINITAIPDIGEGIRHGNPDNRGQTGFFEILKTDVPAPQVGDVILYEGIEWSMAEIAASDYTSFVLKCIANESAVILR